MGKKIDLTGQRFGRLIAIERVKAPPFYSDRHSWWKFRCDCGQEIIRRGTAVTQGATKSCGCLQRREKV